MVLKSTTRRHCLHDGSHVGEPVSLFSWRLLVSKNVLILRLLLLPMSPQLNDSSDKGLGVGRGGTGVLNNLYVEHVFRWSMRSALTHLIWHRARNVSSLRGERDWRSEQSTETEAKRSKRFLPASPFPVWMSLCISLLLTLHDLLLVFYNNVDNIHGSRFYATDLQLKPRSDNLYSWIFRALLSFSIASV